MPAEIKRSVSIAGHRTSISLERPFWDALKEIACSQDVSVNELVRRIDEARDSDGNLSGAVRVYVLAHFRNKSAACPA
ncbi:MAG TPA: ribbon-helix-helix domain-containing protein [Parvibaculum sp.]